MTKTPFPLQRSEMGFKMELGVPAQLLQRVYKGPFSNDDFAIRICIFEMTRSFIVHSKVESGMVQIDNDIEHWIW